jgi:hypothetical protein
MLVVVAVMTYHQGVVCQPGWWRIMVLCTTLTGILAGMFNDHWLQACHGPYNLVRAMPRRECLVHTTVRLLPGLRLQSSVAPVLGEPRTGAILQFKAGPRLGFCGQKAGAMSRGRA